MACVGVWIHLFAILTVGWCDKSRYEAEDELRKSIFASYNKAVPPLVDPNENITVKFALMLNSVDELDITRQVLKTHVWLNLMWKDVRLKWNPSDFGGLDGMSVSTDIIWKPDMAPYNSAGQFTPSAEYLAVVKNDGTVIYVPHVHLSTTCSVDLSQFPFDEQTCMMKFGSWTYDGEVIALTGGTIDLSTYCENNIWSIVSHSGQVSSTKYSCCPQAFYDYTVKLTLRRRTGILMNMYVGPAACISLLIPFVFLLPAHSSSKLILGSGLLIAHMLLLEMLAELLPVDDLKFPRLGIYYLANIILISLSLALSSIIVCLWERSKRGGPGVPPVIHKVFLGVLARLLSVKKEQYIAGSDGGDTSQGQTTADDQARIVHDYNGVVLPAEWRQLAVTLDRLFVLLFLIVTISAVIAMLAYPRSN